MNVEEEVLLFFKSKGAIPEKREEQMSCTYLEEKLIDSMGIIEMITEFEKLFDIYFETHHMQSVEFRTIGGLVTLIENLLHEQSHGISRAHPS